MSCTKKDLEIIFNLQWKYGPKVAERSNIVGVYDLPTTTLNWEPFKSYILKNSGTPGDDVKVSYIKDGKEIPIESTLDFQTALYFFRKKAMIGEVINLKLERLSIGNKSFRYSPTCDAQTECNYDNKMDAAPEWFINYMAEFKRDVLSEVASAVIAQTAGIRSSVSHSHYPRKSKTECSKRCRKCHHHDVNEKEVLKTLKMEKKLESKMEKLVNKSKKLKEKKMSLVTKSSDSDAGHSSSKSNSEAILTGDISLMNAAPLRCEEPKIPHFMGGEVYRHCWKVINNGLVPWTQDTELHFSWGSSLLQPIQKVIPCPLLQPKESGEIEALIHVPKICGKYQMYWHFYHKGRKFGQWLGCEIIVDKINPAEEFTSSLLRNLSTKYDIPDMVAKMDSECRSSYSFMLENSIDEDKKEKASVQEIENKMEDLDVANATSTPLPPLASEIEEIWIDKSPSKIQIIENYMNEIGKNKKESEDKRAACTAGIDIIENYMKEIGKNKKGSWESVDMQGEVAKGGVNVDEGDSHSESISKIDEDEHSNSTLNDMVMVNFPEEQEQKNEGYAYVVIDGVKTAVPKKFLRPDFLETAEDAPEPEKVERNINTLLGLRLNPDIVYSSRSEKYERTDDEEDDDDDMPDLESSNGNAVYFVNKERSHQSPEFEFVSEPRLDELPELISTDSELDVYITRKPQKTQKVYKHKLSRGSIRLRSVPPMMPVKLDDDCLSDRLPRVPNYMQTPPELRPNMNGENVAAPADTEVTSTAKTETVTVSTTAQEAASQVRSQNGPAAVPSTSSDSGRARNEPEAATPIASVVSEAMTMASSALKNVVNKIIPSKNDSEVGVWLNGHWVPTVENSIREKNLKTLADMGFINRDLNATLLARYNDDIRRVVAELVQ